MKLPLSIVMLTIGLLLPCQIYAQTIGVSIPDFDDKWLTTLRTAMQAHGQKQKNLHLEFANAQTSVVKQFSQIRDFINHKVDAIIVVPVNTDLTPQITKLVSDAKVPLVYVNRQPSDTTLPPRVAFVGSNESQSGTMQMQAVCKLLHGKGNIVVLMGDLANQAARQRTQDVKDVIATPACNQIKIMDARAGNWMRMQGMDIMTGWIANGVKFDAVVSNNDEMALGAIRSLKLAGKLDKRLIVSGIDATQDALRAMEMGELQVTVYQNAKAQGSTAVDTAQKLISGRKTPSTVWVPFELVTPDNVQHYLDK